MGILYVDVAPITPLAKLKYIGHDGRGVSASCIMRYKDIAKAERSGKTSK